VKVLKWTLVTGAGLALFFMATAPGFLIYSTPAIADADAVVLLIGPDNRPRTRAAVDLVNQEKGRYLMVPANRFIAKPDLPVTEFNLARTYTADPDNRPVYPKHVEGTHVELLVAREMMDEAGLTSANLVSSPYHMRRIQVIADRVFDTGKYRLAFVPTPYETPTDGPWFMNKWDRDYVVEEWAKILWLWIYAPFYGG
jgi:hypothetical protein